jgi:hypothetical protein
MKKWLLVAVLICLFASICAGLFALVRPDPPIPGKFKKQLTSTLLLPTPDIAVIDQTSVKYAADIKVLSLNTSLDGVAIALSEQPTPESFTDIPQAYDKVIEQMHEYRKFETDIGVVHLTKPPNRHGGQTAVVNTKGTLLFANPIRTLSDDQWRRLFTSMEVVR